MGRARSRQGTAAFINLSLCMPLPVREKGLKLSPCSALMVIGAALHQAGAQAETLHCTPQPPASLGASSPHIPPHQAQRALHAMRPPFQDIFSVIWQAHVSLASHVVMKWTSRGKGECMCQAWTQCQPRGQHHGHDAPHGALFQK